jgi:hypothetical protein
MNKYSKFPAEVVCELHPLFKGLRWVAAARSSDATRHVITNICVEKKDLEWTLVATDGRRLHVHTFDAGLFDTDIEGLEPGLYEVIHVTGKFIVIARSEELELGAYPKWRNVIPDYEPEHDECVTSRTISRLAIRTGVLLASDFTLDAIGFGHGVKASDPVEISYGSSAPKEAFVITHELGKAIVMPMRLDEEEPKAREEGEEEEAPPATEAEATPEFNGFQDLLEGVASNPASEAAREFVENTKQLCAEGGAKSVTISSGGKSVTIDKDGVKASKDEPATV